MTAPKQTRNTPAPIDWAHLVERIAQETGCKRRASGQWTDGSCPAHGGRENFSVRLGANGKALVKCFADCPQDTLIDALRARDLWPDKGAFKSEAESAGERIAARRRAERRREQEREQAEAETQRRAWEVWNKAAIPVPETESDPDFHPYNIERGPGWTGNSGYIRRGPWPFNGGKDKDALLLALVDIEGDLWSIEALGSRADVFEIGKGRDGFKTGRKSFMPGAMRDGIFFPFTDFGAQTRAFYIGEGFFTVQAAMYGVPVEDLADGTRAFLSACTAGKLEAVARAVRTKYPDAEIILLKDEDPAGEAANRAAHAVGGKVARPSAALPDGTHPKEHYDFWDLHHEHGPDAVQAALDAAQAPTLKDTMEDARRAEETQGGQDGPPDETPEQYQALSAGARLEAFWRYAENMAARPHISTGFASLDAFIGGLYPGLYTLSAVPGLGKTSLALQMADYIAEGGQDVLFFSIEVPEFQLQAKSLSRRTWELADGDPALALTARSLWEGGYLNATMEQRAILERAQSEYDFATGGRLWIIESGEQPTSVDDIRARIERHRRNTGRTPIVFVDYFQLLRKTNPQASDKQSADENILALKHISRDFNIPLFTISGLNRGGYQDPDNMASLKESGLIEYTADIIISMKYLTKDGRQAERKADAKIDVDGVEAFHVGVNIIKNRYGRTGEVGNGLIFVPVFNTYTVNDEEFASSEATRRAVLAQALGILCEQLEKQPGRAVRLFPLINGRKTNGCTDEIKAIREYLKIEGGIDGNDIGDVVDYGIEVEKLVKVPDPESRARTPPILIRLANPPEETPQAEDEGAQGGLF